MNKRILLFGDSRFRDSFPLALLKTKLADNDVVVSPFDLWESALELYRPHIVVLNHAIGSRNRKIARKAKALGALIVVMPTEGRPNTTEQVEWYKRENKGTDLFLSWGVATEGVENSKTVGCVRFEIYTNYQHLINKPEFFKQKNRINPRDSVHVFFSSFPQAKFAHMNQAFNERDWKDLLVTSIPGREDPALFARREASELRSFMREIVKQDSGHVIVIKPHPMEDVESWRRFADEFGFVLSLMDFSHNAINAANIVTSRYHCLTIVESFLLNKPVNVVMRDESTGPGAVLDIDSDYVNKYFFLDGSPSSRAAAEICALDVQNIDNPTTQQRISFAKLLMEFDHKHIYPNIFDMHLGKAVTQQSISSWESVL